MSPVPEDQMLAPWKGLQGTLAGFFSAHARGLLASDFALLDLGGREVGWLRVHGPKGAELEAGNLTARIKRTAPRRYAMVAGGAQVLSAETAGSPDAMQISRAEHMYEASLGLLRNTAEAHLSTGDRVSRITGGFTNRRYEVAFDTDDAGSLPIAIFLLYHLVALRRGAYRTGAEGG